MDGNNLTNQELANNYFRVMTQYSADLHTYKIIKRKIENAEFSIVDSYKKNGNLEDLKISGIGSKTKETLESILTIGFQQTRKLKEKEKIENIERDLFSGIESKVPVISDYDINY